MKRAFAYLVILFATLWLLEKTYDICLRSNVNIKASYVARKKINADVLFLGTSNTLFGIIPDVFEQSCGRTMYNLSTNHASFAENLAHLHLYLINNEKPKLLVIGLSLSDLTISHSAFHSYLFAPFINDQFISALIAQNDPFYFYLSYMPFMKYAYYNQYINPFAFKGFTHIIERDTIAYFEKGTYYTPSDTSGIAHFSDTAKVYHHRIQYTFTGVEERELKNLMEYAQENGIKILLYEPAYLATINKDYIGRTEAIQKVRSIAKQCHSDYWTFDTLKMCSQRKNFMSVFHTSGKAAGDFTKMFAEKLCKEL